MKINECKLNKLYWCVVYRNKNTKVIESEYYEIELHKEFIDIVNYAMGKLESDEEIISISYCEIM